MTEAAAQSHDRLKMAENVLLMLGVAGMMKGPVDLRALALLGTPCALLTFALLVIARRARRNKTTF